MPGILDWIRNQANVISDELQKALPARCPIPWRPNALEPVFYGYRDVAPDTGVFHRARDMSIDWGAPTPMRILFPSLDGSPQYGQILWPCGLFPLIVLCHGHCPGDANHYLDWASDILAAQLARSGYVVAVPLFPGIAGGSHPAETDGDLNLLGDVVSWLRSDWVHARQIAPEPNTGVLGHSYGGVLAGRFSAGGRAKAYASLSGDWTSFNDPASVLRAIDIPKLFVWGSDSLQDILTLNDQDWNSLISTPKHRAVIDDMFHFDYLPAGVAACERGRGFCRYTRNVAADLVTMFFARYLPPPAVPDLPSQIPDTLIPPSLDLTMQQEFYAGGHLRGFTALAGAGEECNVTVSWWTGTESGSVSKP